MATKVRARWGGPLFMKSKIQTEPSTDACTEAEPGLIEKLESRRSDLQRQLDELSGVLNLLHQIRCVGR